MHGLNDPKSNGGETVLSSRDLALDGKKVRFAVDGRLLDWRRDLLCSQLLRASVY